MTRFTKITAAATAITLMGSAAFATIPVEKVDVTVDVTAIENVKAAAVWKNISDDLETALAERLVDQLDEEGAEVLIDIDEVSLANNFEQRLDIADTMLRGDVKLKVPGLGNNETYTLTVRSAEAVALLPSDEFTANVTVGSEVFYQAMIESFADNVVEKLQ